MPDRFLKISLVFVLLIASLVVFGQKSYSVRCMAHTETMSHNGTPFFRSGISIEIFVHEKFSLDYNFLFAYNGNKEYMFQLPVSALPGLYTHSEGILALAMIVPEGVSVHGSPYEWMEVAGFINPLGFGLTNLQDFEYYMCFEAGIKMHFKNENILSISPRIGMHVPYNSKKIGHIFGLSLGILID